MADATRFAGRVALITGGAAGIGLASAHRMVAEGGQVVLWDVDAAALERARAEFGDCAMCQRVDVTKEDDIAAALRSAMAHFGRLDIVVNSAGITGPTEPFWQHTTASWRRVLDLNLDAVFFVSRAAVPHLIAAGGGRIVNMASIAGKEGNRHQAAYSASKAGVIGLTKSMGKDLVEHNILVNAVAPAAIEGELIKQMPQSQIDFVRAKIPMNRLGRLEEVAALVCWLASEDCSFNTGAVFDISGGRATY
jgi:2-dehydro-3-deoxy-L-rhamnonate dehydrogenase (NAD+)